MIKLKMIEDKKKNDKVEVCMNGYTPRFTPFRERSLVLARSRIAKKKSFLLFQPSRIAKKKSFLLFRPSRIAKKKKLFAFLALSNREFTSRKFFTRCARIALV